MFFITCRQWRRPGAEFGGRKFLSRTKVSELHFFRTNFRFHAQNFWWPIFLVMDQVFLIVRIFTVLNVVYDPFFTRKSHYLRKEFLDDTFFYSVRTFARIRQHYFSKYWGGRMHGPSPTSNFGGPSFQFPLGLRPCVSRLQDNTNMQVKQHSKITF